MPVADDGKMNTFLKLSTHNLKSVIKTNRKTNIYKHKAAYANQRIHYKDISNLGKKNIQAFKKKKSALPNHVLQQRRPQKFPRPYQRQKLPHRSKVKTQPKICTW